MGIERPWCCPERRCAPLHREGVADPDRPGESWTCFGRMPAPVSFTYAGNEHTNDLNRCVFTPLKGLIRFQENAADWALDVYAIETALGILLDIPADEVRKDRWRWLKRIPDDRSP